MEHVKGNDKGSVKLYALSTCGWCEKDKNLLEDLGVDFSYVYVDLLEGKEREEVMKEVERWNPRRTFPTLVINKSCVVGFDERKIKKELKI